MLVNHNAPIKNYFDFHASKPVKKSNFPAIRYSGQAPINTLNPDISTGWELEAENVMFPDEPIPFHRILAITDGSLKDNGVEFITIGGLKGTTLYDSIIECHEIEKMYNQKYKFSHRCSFHVHLDVRDFTWNQLFNLIAVSILAEPYLFSLCAAHRKGNSYCIPLNQLNMSKRDIGNISFKDSKYWAMSFNRLVDLGTVEYRMLHGTNNPNELINWITKLHKLYAYAKNISTRELFITLRRAPDVQSLLSSIFETPLNLADLTDELFYARANAIIYLEG